MVGAQQVLSRYRRRRRKKVTKTKDRDRDKDEDDEIAVGHSEEIVESGEEEC